MNFKGKSILLVDDDPEMRVILKRILENAGASIQEAGSTREAIEKCKTFFPHLIISDLQMQPETGFELIAQLKREPNYRKIPVIVVSSLSDKQSVYKAIAVGAKDYVLKPVDAKQVLRRAYRQLSGQPILKYDFKEKESPIMVADFVGRMRAMGEASMKVEITMRFNQRTEVIVRSALLDELGLNHLVLRAHERHYSYTNKGHYSNTINFLGVREVDAAKIRKVVRTWEQ